MMGWLAVMGWLGCRVIEDLLSMVWGDLLDRVRLDRTKDV
jgi:hypothetical protein